jgi:hypothetical protein
VLSIVYLARRSNLSIIDELVYMGLQVWEVLSVPEVLHICEHHKIDAVVIATDVNDAELAEVRSKWITLRPQPFASATQIFWELRQLLDKTGTVIQ